MHAFLDEYSDAKAAFERTTECRAALKEAWPLGLEGVTIVDLLRMHFAGRSAITKGTDKS